MRASDADRARVADVLHRHTADGRLTLDEFDQRAAAAYAARTIGDLDVLTVDLPPLTESTRGAEPSKEPATSSAAPRLWALAGLVVALIAASGLIGGVTDAAAAGAMMDGMCH
ncbi:DUF1707 SHOCT-like domain-containing protein [Haloechinothrix halophila]|uniref:DUF1707 SHOCT-like domain-containing protein n=1 Tax=Haloechinothrix halophila TaxID=1069073 RepID=UPI00068497DF|nr:DUF1707 domain-containing protein [Haloechinothrix halophila]